MKTSEKALAADFATEILRADYAAAHKFFASWIEISPEKLREFVENELEEVAEAAELDEMIYPANFELDQGAIALEDLREPRSYPPLVRSAERFPDEITPENFRAWLVIAFLPSEDQDIDVDGWFDFWCAVVEENGELKIGYFEITEPD